MKKTILIFVIAALVLVSLIVWAVKSDFSGGNPDILMMTGALIVVGFAVYLGALRIRSKLRKEPFEDELSKREKTKASSLSFYISIYMWLLIMYVSDKTELETHSLIGAGIMGMALVFFLCWIGVKYIKPRYE
jgi:hypothetical protein